MEAVSSPTLHSPRQARKPGEFASEYLEKTFEEHKTDCKINTGVDAYLEILKSGKPSGYLKFEGIDERDSQGILQILQLRCYISLAAIAITFFGEYRRETAHFFRDVILRGEEGVEDSGKGEIESTQVQLGPDGSIYIVNGFQSSRTEHVKAAARIAMGSPRGSTSGGFQAYQGKKEEGKYIMTLTTALNLEQAGYFEAGEIFTQHMLALKEPQPPGSSAPGNLIPVDGTYFGEGLDAEVNSAWVDSFMWIKHRAKGLRQTQQPTESEKARLRGEMGKMANMVLYEVDRTETGGVRPAGDPDKVHFKKFMAWYASFLLNQGEELYMITKEYPNDSKEQITGSNFCYIRLDQDKLDRLNWIDIKDPRILSYVLEKCLLTIREACSIAVQKAAEESGDETVVSLRGDKRERAIDEINRLPPADQMMKWIPCTSDCMNFLSALVNNEFDQTWYHLCLLNYSIFTEENEACCMLSFSHPLTGKWEKDQHYLIIKFGKIGPRGFEEQTDSYYVPVCGPSAVGKTYMSRQMLPLLSILNNYKHLIFLSIDGGIARETSLIYDLTKVLSWKYSGGLKNLGSALGIKSKSVRSAMDSRMVRQGDKVKVFNTDIIKNSQRDFLKRQDGICILHPETFVGFEWRWKEEDRVDKRFKDTVEKWCGEGNPCTKPLAIFYIEMCQFNGGGAAMISELSKHSVHDIHQMDSEERSRIISLLNLKGVHLDSVDKAVEESCCFSAALPSGWVQKDHNGRPYYVNTSTSKSVWIRPEQDTDFTCKSVTLSGTNREIAEGKKYSGGTFTQATSLSRVLLNKTLEQREPWAGNLPIMWIHNPARRAEVGQKPVATAATMFLPEEKQELIFSIYEYLENKNIKVLFLGDESLLGESTSSVEEEGIGRTNYLPFKGDDQIGRNAVKWSVNRQKFEEWCRGKDPQQISAMMKKKVGLSRWLSAAHTVMERLSPDPLPPGWEEMEQNGRPYYVNESTGERTWDRPGAADKGPAMAEPAMAEPAMAEPEMAEPAMAEPEMAEPEMAAPPKKKPEHKGATALPSGWVQKIHEGRPYYVNTLTNESQWPEPTEPAQAPAQAPAPASEPSTRPLPKGWVQKEHEGRAYYVNTDTGASLWKRPEEGDDGQSDYDEGEEVYVRHPGPHARWVRATVKEITENQGTKVSYIIGGKEIERELAYGSDNIQIPEGFPPSPN